MESWIRPKLRVADNPTMPSGAKNKLKQKLKPPPGIPDPNTRDGRHDMIDALRLSVGEVSMRAKWMKTIVEKALAAENRQDFKEELILMTDQVTQMKMRSVPDVVDTLLKTIETYEKSQGRKFVLDSFIKSKGKNDDPEIELTDEDLEEIPKKSARTARVDWVAYFVR